MKQALKKVFSFHGKGDAPALASSSEKEFGMLSDTGSGEENCVARLQVPASSFSASSKSASTPISPASPAKDTSSFAVEGGTPSAHSHPFAPAAAPPHSPSAPVACNTVHKSASKPESTMAAPTPNAQSGTATTADTGAPKADSVTIAVARHCPSALRRQQWSLDDFELRKLMYNGAISMVYHAVDKRTGITVALKLYKRHKLNDMERHQVAREIRLHVDLTHDAIITMYAAWKDRSYVYLALEWAPGGDVYTFLKSQKGRLGEEVAVPLILEPFMAGLAAIHAKGLIHRDIKPENILLNNSYQVKIADFGLSIDSRQEIANTRLGTIDYLAPEILDCPVKSHPMDHKDRPDTGYTNLVDCWSVGVLAYELLCGYPPFAAPTAQETLRLIRTKRVEYPGFMSPGALDFIQTALVRDPGVRPSIAALLDHPWIVRLARRNQTADNRVRRVQARSTVDGTLMRSLTEANMSSHTMAKAAGMAVMASASTAGNASPAPAAAVAVAYNSVGGNPTYTAPASGPAAGATGAENPSVGSGLYSVALPPAPGSPTPGSGGSPKSPPAKSPSMLGRKLKFWSSASGKTVPASYSFGPSSAQRPASPAPAPLPPALPSGAVPPVAVNSVMAAADGRARKPSLPPLNVPAASSATGMAPAFGSMSPVSAAGMRSETKALPARSISSAGAPPARKPSALEHDTPAAKQSLFNRLFS